MKVAFIGDISFNDDYIELYKKGVNPFNDISSKLGGYDLLIGNLECISEGSDGENELKKPRLKTKIETLNYLKTLNISAVSLAHNHIYDNLKDGYLKTIGFLDSNNIDHIGAGLSVNEAKKPLLVKNNGSNICLLSYVHEDTNPNLPENCPLFVNIYEKNRVIAEIKQYKKEQYFIVLLLHWGGKFEGGQFPDRYQQTDAKDFIESGADLIIGHHSHTLQPYEKIKGKFVFYSLGNFCFSNISFEGKQKKVLNMSRYTESVIVTCDLTPGKSDINIIPIKNNKLILRTSRKVIVKLYIRNLLFKYFLSIPIFYKMYSYSFYKIYPYIKMLRNFNNISYIRKLRDFFYTLSSK
jgi:poly-gamma-glutamate capsule biosynthesis protein CapA/YwtB (metallophosphatase superfamily)